MTLLSATTKPALNQAVLLRRLENKKKLEVRCGILDTPPTFASMSRAACGVHLFNVPMKTKILSLTNIIACDMMYVIQNVKVK